ncbi:MAG: hypothetical protein LC798_13760 [Chloroflexi bacterium]|nr:hypothetical protein [Chloroflexota bacterium]
MPKKKSNDAAGDRHLYTYVGPTLHARAGEDGADLDRLAKDGGLSRKEFDALMGEMDAALKSARVAKSASPEEKAAALAKHFGKQYPNVVEEEAADEEGAADASG